MNFNIISLNSPNITYEQKELLRIVYLLPTAISKKTFAWEIHNFYFSFYCMAKMQGTKAGMSLMNYVRGLIEKRLTRKWRDRFIKT